MNTPRRGVLGRVDEDQLEQLLGKFDHALVNVNMLVGNIICTRCFTLYTLLNNF